MKKVNSKSIIPNKHKSKPAESKRNSRITSTNSCLKITPQSTEQISSKTLPLQPTLSKQNLLNYSHKTPLPITHTHTHSIPNNHLQPNSQPQTHRTSCRIGKSSIETIPAKENRDQLAYLKHCNEAIIKENANLKQKCFQLQEMSLKDKEKIKNLIIRINEVKAHKQINSQTKTLYPSTSKPATRQDIGSISYSFLPQKIKLQTPCKAIDEGQCQNRECIQRKRYLQSELYLQRVKRDQLQLQQREWEANRQLLKLQYNGLLDQIRSIKQSSL